MQNAWILGMAVAIFFLVAGTLLWLFGYRRNNGEDSEEEDSSVPEIPVPETVVPKSLYEKGEEIVIRSHRGGMRKLQVVAHRGSQLIVSWPNPKGIRCYAKRSPATLKRLQV